MDIPGQPQTYDDQRIEELSRRVYFKALTKLEAEMDRETGGNPERIAALSSAAESAANGFAPEDEKEEEV